MHPKTHKIAADGLNFGRNAHRYDAVRPGYPEDVIALCKRLSAGGVTLDLGAGTGKFGQALMQTGAPVIGVDPDEDLLALNPCPYRVGVAENIPAQNSEFTQVVVAQAWHWFNQSAALHEISRVLAPSGTLTIIINQLDVRINWVMRIARIIHAGDVYKPEWRPELGPKWSDPQAQVFSFSQAMTIERLKDLAATRSYWLRSSQKVRERIVRNIEEFLAGENLVGDTFELPYLCLVYAAHKMA